MSGLESLPRLGKQAAKYDSRTLKLARYLDLSALPTPPASTTRSSAVAEWPMYANDRIGDCTCAGMAHMVEFWLGLSRLTDFSVTEADVIAAYTAIAGYDPQTGANDNGAVELDVLSYWTNTGIGGHRISAYAAVNLANRDLVRAACWLFDGLYIGCALPASAQGQPSWEYRPETGSQAYPGSWGGHCVNVVDYDETGVTVVTWGKTLHMSWDFWDHYVDEAYAIIAPEAFANNGNTIEGFNVQALVADLECVRS